MESKRPIGASYNKYGTVLKGIEGEEERKVMPEILGISANDLSFNKKCEEFWYNISIQVKHGSGTKLNITVRDGVPLYPLDYIKWKFALVHKQVAKTENSLEGNPYALFYIFDPISAQTLQISELKIRNDAKLKYLELIQDEAKVDAVIAVLTDYKNPSILSKEEKELILEDRSSKKAEEFIKVVTDKKLIMKAFVYRAISAGVFKQSGSRLMYDEVILGENLDSTVAFLHSKEGSKYYVTAEGKLNEWYLIKK